MQWTKEKLRQCMPSVGKAVDEFRSIFGPGVRVLWAKEGEFEVGKIPASKSAVIMFEPDSDNRKMASKSASELSRNKFSI
jgi:putative component of toxin-antitoxin plasmid stabilization module